MKLSVTALLVKVTFGSHSGLKRFPCSFMKPFWLIRDNLTVGTHVPGKRDSCTRIRQRLENLCAMTTKFEIAEWKGDLPCRLDKEKKGFVSWKKRADGSWLLPQSMTQDEFSYYLPVMFEGPNYLFAKHTMHELHDATNRKHCNLMSGE